MRVSLTDERPVGDDSSLLCTLKEEMAMAKKYQNGDMLKVFPNVRMKKYGTQGKI